MKSILAKSILAILSALSLAAAAGCATSQPKKAAENANHVATRVTYQTAVGPVIAYAPGKRIALAVSENQIREFEIEQNAEVVGRIVPGRTARVEFFKSSDGPERVLTIQEASASPAR